MTKRIIRICGTVCAAIFLLYVSNTSGVLKKSSGLKLIVFPTGHGWGYQVDKNNKTLIYQPFIPAIQGKRPFPTSVSARNVGEKVIGKIRANQVPMVTTQELISEGIACNSAF